jgi:hypothetical protein
LTALEQFGGDTSRASVIRSRHSRSPAAIATRNPQQCSAYVSALLALLAATTLSAAPAHAQPAEPLAPPPASPPAAAAPVPDLEAPPEVVGDEEAPPDEHADLHAQIEELRRQLADTQDVVLHRRSLVTVGGYIDFGFFAAQGDGTGIVQDPNSATSAYAAYHKQYGWVFLGDLLAPAVNSRGEPASLGNLPGVDRFDSINSGGAPGFIVNEVNMTLTAAIAESALATASVDFIPRSGFDFRLGDVFEVDLAQVEWMPGATRRTSIFAGKMESVLGIEYRERKAAQRFGITPSLIARYTTGTPLGVKVRSKLGTDDWFTFAAAVTNGSSTTEMFHFYDEVDSNAGKTGSARLAVAPVRALELGVSGEYGPQDHDPYGAGALWFWGVDLQAHLGRLEVKGQFLQGRGAGENGGRVYAAPQEPYGLRLNKGGYLEGDLMITSRLGLLGRGELRDALVWLGDPNALGGADRIYITKVWRATAGLRFAPNEHVVLKLEALHNGEYGGLPQIRDDVVTSSLLLIY